MDEHGPGNGAVSSLTHGSLSVEVVICTYNGERFVSEQIQTILNQTVGVNRLSIHDDCSSDRTVVTVEGVLSDHAGKLANSVHVNPRNLGYARNFASAIEQATADVIFLCDQDDQWEPEKVQVLMDLLVRTGADMVFSDGSPVDSEGNIIPGPTVLGKLGLARDQAESFAATAWPELLRRNVVNGAACAIRRSAAQAALPLPTDMPHDQWLALWCAAHGGVAATSLTLYRYRQHDRNVIGMGSSRALYHWLGIWRQPRLPRLRELRVWRAIHERLAPHVSGERRLQLDAKLKFLEDVVGAGTWRTRAWGVLCHALRGSYRHLAPPTALRRDMLGLWRTDEMNSSKS